MLWDGTNYTRAWLEALIWARSEFYDRGYNIIFFKRENYTPYGVREELKFNKQEACSNEFDIVFCVYHNAGGDIIDPQKQVEIIQEIKKRCNTLIWFDALDSTGDTSFYLTEYVDRYLKQQLLKNKKLYLKPMYGNRIWCDFYHTKYELEDSKYGGEEPLLQKLEQLENVGLSWNFGMSKMVWDNPIVLADCDRKIDLYYRGSRCDSITHYQRKLVVEKINSIKNMEIVNPEEHVSKEVYIKEISDSRSVISPCGWGELCFRDYETFIAGAALIKPYIGYVETYPDCFVEYETYIPIKWDFSNFDDVISFITEKKKNKIIAEAGQERYMRYVKSPTAKQMFVEHVLQECKLL